MHHHLFQKLITGLATRYGRSFPDLEAEDLIQDGFVALLQSTASTQSSNKNTYIDIKRQIGNRLSRSRYQHGKYRKVAKRLYAEGCDKPINTVERQAETEELRSVLENALNQLPQKQKEAVKISFGLGNESVYDLSLIHPTWPKSELLRSRLRRALKSLSKVPELRQIYSEISL